MKKPLLVIELQDSTSVPKVVYDGVVIEGKQRVTFDWETGAGNVGGVSFSIKNLDVINGHTVSTSIEKKYRKHAGLD